MTPTITIREVKLHDGRTLHMKEPLVLLVSHYSGIGIMPGGYYASHVDLCFEGFGDTLEDLKADLEESVASSWKSHIEPTSETDDPWQEYAASLWREVAEVREGEG